MTLPPLLLAVALLTAPLAVHTLPRQHWQKQQQQQQQQQQQDQSVPPPPPACVVAAERDATRQCHHGTWALTSPADGCDGGVVCRCDGDDWGGTACDDAQWAGHAPNLVLFMLDDLGCVAAWMPSEDCTSIPLN